jgi:hypothetical protein
VLSRLARKREAMKTYRVVWLVVWGVVAALGAAVALILSAQALAVLFLIFAVLGGMLPLSLVRDYDERSVPDRLRLIGTGALMGGTTAGAVVGFALLLGEDVLLLVLFLLISSPYAMTAYGRWLSSASRPSAAQLGALARALAYTSPAYLPVPPSSEVGMLTDAELCQKWRSSFLALQAQPSSRQMIRTVVDRERYLDEFERRNPRGFASRLVSGALVPDDPRGYLTRSRVDPPAINWDELTRGQEY